MERVPRELVAIWTEKVRRAKAQYTFARNQFNESVQKQQGWPLPAPDGSYSVRYFRHVESYALQEYRRVLRIHTALVVEGKIPRAAAPHAPPGLD